jgi:hypothetical protein
MQSVHMDSVIVEYDCSVVVVALNASTINGSAWWTIYEEAKELRKAFQSHIEILFTIK